MCSYVVYHLHPSWVVSCFLQRLAPPTLYGLAAKTKNVPNCLVSHLNFIHFKGYQAYLHEMEFAAYVLRNGLVLKTMLISGLLLDKKEKWEKYLILKEFADIPKGSANCQLKFDWVVPRLLKVHTLTVSILCGVLNQRWCLVCKIRCSFPSFYMHVTTFSTVICGGMELHNFITPYFDELSPFIIEILSFCNNLFFLIFVFKFAL